MKTVTAVVAWFVNVEVEVSDDSSEDDIRDSLYQKANERLVGPNNVKCLKASPIIHECETDPDLVD